MAKFKMTWQNDDLGEMEESFDTAKAAAEWEWTRNAHYNRVWDFNVTVLTDCGEWVGKWSQGDFKDIWTAFK